MQLFIVIMWEFFGNNNKKILAQQICDQHTGTARTVTHWCLHTDSAVKVDKNKMMGENRN